MRRRRRSTAVTVGIVLALAGAAASCSSGVSASGEKAATPRAAGDYAVPATRQPLTTDPQSPVAHDTETDAIVAHSGRLFASTDQWEYPGRAPSGQILVKDSATSGWTLFEQTQSLRVEEALNSFPIPADQGLGPGHSLLITHAVVDGRSEIQWLLDGATAFAPSDSYVLPSNVADVRSFGAHQTGGVWSVYAGVEPTGVLRASWSPTRHTLVFDPVPELIAAAPGSPGLRTQKATGFADCAGALYVTIDTKLFRRNDGPLPARAGRWTLLYQGPPAGAHNSGLRGLSCVTGEGAPFLLVSTEGTGNVYRLDHLPEGQVDAPDSLVATMEFSPVSAIRRMLGAQGTSVPAKGKGAIDYVIAAYNNFTTVDVGGVTRQAFGFEWAYLGGCPPTRTCGPSAFGAATFDAAACFAVRTEHGPSPAYALRCLSGPEFTAVAHGAPPIRSGQAFVSIRTMAASPFHDGRLYYGGYDCNFYPADGTAWIASSTLSALQ